jgi:cell division protease FtsH
MARRMVCEWGMSEVMGPLTFGKKEEQIFLGREIAQHTDYSEDTALKIDAEVKRIVSDQYTRCTQLLTEHKQRLIDIADALLAREILDADQVRRLAYGHPLDDAPSAELPSDDAKPAKEKERPSIVPPMEPIRKPLTQE